VKRSPSDILDVLFKTYDFEHTNINISSKLRKVERLLNEAEAIEQSIENNRGLPKRYRINNPLIDCEYSYQTKLASLSEEEARAILREASITGREGFFCLV